MKKIRNIILLTLSLTGIVFFWLLPKTKGERKTEYVRVYTEEKEIPVKDDSAKTSVEKKSITTPPKTKKERVIIQVDTLYEKIRLKDIKPSIYSRSMHFRPKSEMVEVPTVSSDSIHPMVADTTTF